MSNNSRAIRPRISGLDGIRAVAVTIVIATHAHAFWPQGGRLVLDVFFVLSGFLVVGLLVDERLKNGRVDVTGFWIRRAVRLLPALVVVLVVVEAVVLARLSRGPNDYLADTVHALPFVVSGTSNWVPVLDHETTLGWFAPMWSLSVETQYYVLIPIVLVVTTMFVGRGHSIKPFVVVLVVGAVAIAGLRPLFFDGTDFAITLVSWFRFDGVLIGALLALAIRGPYRALAIKICRSLSWPAILYLLWVLTFIPPYGRPGEDPLPSRLYHAIGLPAVIMASAIIIGHVACTQDGRATRLLSLTPIRHLGVLSYAVYLWHFPVQQAITSIHRMDPNLTYLLTFALSILIAEGSYRWVERPVQRRLAPLVAQHRERREARLA